MFKTTQKSMLVFWCSKTNFLIVHIDKSYRVVVILYSGITPLGSGWANPWAPGLGGHLSEGENFLRKMFLRKRNTKKGKYEHNFIKKWALNFFLYLMNISPFSSVLIEHIFLYSPYIYCFKDTSMIVGSSYYDKLGQNGHKITQRTHFFFTFYFHFLGGTK